MTCAKARVVCRIVTPDGYAYEGDNGCRIPQARCPRTGDAYQRDDYRLCRDICHQPGHAEVMALRAAREWAVGATAYVSHHRVCDDCMAALKRAGVARVVVNGAEIALQGDGAAAATLTPETPPEGVQRDHGRRDTPGAPPSTHPGATP